MKKTSAKMSFLQGFLGRYYFLTIRPRSMFSRNGSRNSIDLKAFIFSTLLPMI